MSLAKQLDRHELVLAVWSAAFVRGLGSQTLVQDATRMRRAAEDAAKAADHAVEALRLLFDVTFEPVSTDDCYMPWDEFVACCQTNAFTDDDGHGELATADSHVSDVRVHPGDALDGSYVRPTWATHVCWYNK